MGKGKGNVDYWVYLFPGEVLYEVNGVLSAENSGIEINIKITSKTKVINY